MTAPARTDVDAMARILAAMRGEAVPASPARPGAMLPAPVPVGPPGGPSDTDKNAMAEVLRRFHAATDGTVQRLVAESATDPGLREALSTEATTEGARIGQWTIAAHENGGRKLYDVARTDNDGERIATDLTLYEAALALVRLLNSGKGVNSPVVLDLLRDEQSYTSALHDAVLFKRRLVEDKNSHRRETWDARYSAAKDLAVAARERIKRRVKDLD